MRYLKNWNKLLETLDKLGVEYKKAWCGWNNDLEELIKIDNIDALALSNDGICYGEELLYWNDRFNAIKILRTLYDSYPENYPSLSCIEDITSKLKEAGMNIESDGLTYNSISDVPDPDKPSGMSETDYKTMMTRAEDCPSTTLYYKGFPIVAEGTYYNPKKKNYKIVDGVDKDGNFIYVKYRDNPNRDAYFYSLADVKYYINNFMLKQEVIESFGGEIKSNSEKINDFIEDLYDLRKESIAKGGEYGLGNLVFKEFRNLGYLDNLKGLKNKEKSKELSLESIK